MAVIVVEMLRRFGDNCWACFKYLRADLREEDLSFCSARDLRRRASASAFCSILQWKKVGEFWGIVDGDEENFAPKHVVRVIYINST